MSPCFGSDQLHGSRSAGQGGGERVTRRTVRTAATIVRNCVWRCQRSSSVGDGLGPQDSMTVAAAGSNTTPLVASANRAS